MRPLSDQWLAPWTRWRHRLHSRRRWRIALARDIDTTQSLEQMFHRRNKFFAIFEGSVEIFVQKYYSCSVNSCVFMGCKHAQLRLRSELSGSAPNPAGGAYSAPTP